jgi:hypothetical protein
MGAADITEASIPARFHFLCGRRCDGAMTLVPVPRRRRPAAHVPAADAANWLPVKSPSPAEGDPAEKLRLRDWIGVLGICTEPAGPDFSTCQKGGLRRFRPFDRPPIDRPAEQIADVREIKQIARNWRAFGAISDFGDQDARRKIALSKVGT